MITSEREGLRAYMAKVAMQVLEREIELFTKNIGKLAKLSALTMLLDWQFFLMSFERPHCWKRPGRDTDCFPADYMNGAVRSTSALCVFYGVAAMSFGLNALVVGISSWCMVYGPSLAVRGLTCAPRPQFHSRVRRLSFAAYLLGACRCAVPKARCRYDENARE